MKKVLALIVLLVAGMATMVNAQTVKFGHISMASLLEVMPERQTAYDSLQKEADELETMLGTMTQELQTMYEDFQKNINTMSDLVKQAKGEDIQMKQQRIETFRAQADQQLQQKNQELLAPIYEKAKKAISDVAKEQGLIYVFEVNSLLYQSPQSVDILPLAKKKLGIE